MSWKNQSLFFATRTAYNGDASGRNSLTRGGLGTANADAGVLSIVMHDGCDGEDGGWCGGIRPTATTRATCVRAMIGINSWRRNSLVLHRDVDDRLVAFARRQRLCKVASTSFTDGLSATWTAKKRIEQAVSKRHRTHGSSPSNVNLELGDT